MPENPASLRITEKYRSRMLRIRERAQQQARAAWRSVDPNNLDGMGYQPVALALAVTELQREVSRLSAGYLSAFVASELDESPKVPVASALMAGEARSGNDLADSFRRPLIGVKVDIGNGMDREKAVRQGGRRLERSAGMSTDHAARESLRIAMAASDDVEGYKRAVRGTCPICIGKADGSTLPANTPLEIHPGCQCISEPKIRGTREVVERPTGKQMFNDMSSEEQNDIFGEGTAKLLRARKIELEDLVEKVQSPARGEEHMIHVKPLKELE